MLFLIYQREGWLSCFKPSPILHHHNGHNSVELGAKVGIGEVDDVTKEFLGLPLDVDYGLRVTFGPYYQQEVTIDLSTVEPLIAAPHSPANVDLVSKIAGKVKIQQAFLGSCTGGRLTDFRVAAKILKGHRIHPTVRFIIAPGSRRIYRQMLKERLVDVFMDVGAIILPPSCGPCAGLQAGVLGDGEKVISASNRNFRGRMGNPKANVYLASAQTVAASAIMGCIFDPRDLMA